MRQAHQMRDVVFTGPISYMPDGIESYTDLADGNKTKGPVLWLHGDDVEKYKALGWEIVKGG